MELLRIATAGAVDDGKSTLLGRLLYDSKSVLADTLAAVERTNLALLTDGLRAEREQGITMDVAYRYFSTRCGRSSWRTRPATCSTPETWSLVRRQRTSRSCWWTPGAA